jgi:hypothetical protein
MEEAEVRDVKDGQKTNAARWAIGPAALAVVLAAGLSLAGGPARAQDPYHEPTPVPTATPTATPAATATPAGTPFQQPSPPAPPTQPNSGPKFMNPFPVVRTAGTFTSTRTTFTRFTVKTPKGTKLATSCIKFRCTLSRTLRTTKTIHLRSLERSYKPGTKIRLRLTQPGLIGKYVSITTRRNKRPLRVDSCLRPGQTRPVSCGAL